MTYSTNAKNFYEQYVVNLGALVMQVTCLRESETYEAIEELRDGGIIGSKSDKLSMLLEIK